jgi:hypothetical protein
MGLHFWQYNQQHPTWLFQHSCHTALCYGISHSWHHHLACRCSAGLYPSGSCDTRLLRRLLLLQQLLQGLQGGPNAPAGQYKASWTIQPGSARALLGSKVHMTAHLAQFDCPRRLGPAQDKYTVSSVSRSHHLSKAARHLPTYPNKPSVSEQVCQRRYWPANSTRGVELAPRRVINVWAAHTSGAVPEPERHAWMSVQQPGAAWLPAMPLGLTMANERTLKRTDLSTAAACAVTSTPSPQKLQRQQSMQYTQTSTPVMPSLVNTGSVSVSATAQPRCHDVSGPTAMLSISPLKLLILSVDALYVLAQRLC